MKENLLIKITKRQAMKARVAEMENMIKELDKDIQSELTAEKTTCGQYTIWYKRNQIKHGFDQKLAKGFLTDEQRQACETTIEYDYFAIK